MFFTRSVLASAAILSFSAITEGSVLHRTTEEHIEVKNVAADEAQGAWTWRSLFGKRQDLILDCPNDQFAALLDHAPNNDVQGFCNDWLNLDATTVTTEFTPTVTVTTSASETTTQTTTQRTVLTTTVVESTTITASASVRRRMVAAAAQIESIASSIVESVIASGAPASTAEATKKGAARLAAERGLATACSCKQVQPTSTVTDTFTVPAVTTTVGVRVLNIIRQTETRTYTSTATVRESATAEASGDATSATSSTGSVSSRADADSSSSAAAESSADAASSSSAPEDSSSSSVSSAEESLSAPAITTVPIAPTSVEAGNSTATASEGAVVTAIPFSCDEDDVNKDIDQVVGGLRLGYSVYCNTELISQDRVGRPIPVTDATSCAAQCSLLNSQGAQDACQSAVFTPSNATDASTGGTCELFTAAENSGMQTSPAPGSVAIVHTGTFANGDECAALNATTSSITPTITNGPIIIETPGLVTQSSGGGVSRTYVSANTTDAQGFVHYSWYEIYASSANWWAVYETSWACSATLTRTIEQPATTVIEGSTITAIIVTTIIGNGYTTIISGDSTTTIRGGGGAGGATFVPASTTGGDAGLTTFFSTAVQASTGSDGIVTPTPAPSVGGSGNVTVSEEFSTFFSTGSAGIISPSASASLNASISGSVSEEVVVSSTATTLTISGANSTFLSTGGNGVVTPTETPILETIVSSGAATLTLSGSNATAASTGGGGVISPSSSVSASGSSIVSSATTDEGEWDSENSYGPKTSAVVVVSSTILTITSTGASGVETPTAVTAVSSETLIVEISNTTLSGNGSFSTATSIATFNSTGGNGIVTPTVVTEIITTAAGVSNFTSIIATATANSTGGFGVVPPESTLVITETANFTLPVPTPTGNFSTGGVGNFSTGSETAFTISTGASGVIPPASANSTSTGPPFTNSDDDRTGTFSRSTATATSNSTASSGFATPSSNLTTAIETPSTNTTLVLTVPLSTGFTSTVEIPIINSTLVSESVPTPTPTAPANVTSSITTDEKDRTGSFSRSSSIGVNTTSTLTLPVSIESTTSEISETTPLPTVPQTAPTLVVTATTNITLSIPSGDVTLIPPTTRPFDNTTAPLPTPTGNITSESLVSINYSTVPSFSTGNLSTILPPLSTSNITIVVPSPTTNITIIVETPFVPLNSTTAPPPSITVPPASLNSTLSLPMQNSTGPVFTNSDGDRTGRFSRTLSSGVILTTGTGGFGSITATPPPFPTGNSTLPLGPTAPTAEACPSPTEFSTITREVIITTYTVETVPIIAPTCITSDAEAAAPTGLNGTFPTDGSATEPTDASVLPSAIESLASAVSSLTASDAAPTTSEVAPVVSAILSAVSSVVSDVTAPASSDVLSEATAAPVSRFRRSGTLATQEQIGAACKDTGNLVLSPTFNIQPNNSTEGWFVSQFNPTIPIESVTQDNGTIARFRSAFPGQTVALSQPLTLCPGTQYELTALTRQADSRSGCSVQLRIGSNSVFTATPQTSWVSRTERFTAGPGAEGASQDVTLVMSCAGFAGAAVGADAEGYMVGEVGAVSVSAEQLRQ
ncbi:uncharacterized protein M421DRAFT_227623 [Didymella exigua CBS 183.55]|uniref:Apple domain-containing protein n=1 Tax=Didymella exigua CBS 183.55 TaxID=1150837 RepID=A0A6A5RCF4_9PLEO|nr:uncharacterized protein M421DRAFT_227623 [Didymella exigua CBS 183.55]KAF1925925.1 hypothetical protein M421DRAFT_227623 [Didymella exigua CBS 183.55]